MVEVAGGIADRKQEEQCHGGQQRDLGSLPYQESTFEGGGGLQDTLQT